VKKKPIPRKTVQRNVKRALEPYVEEAETFAQEFIEEAASALDEKELDLTIDSIRGLDRACRFVKEKFDDALILKAGFYFGEMLRLHFKAKYEWDPRHNFLALNVEGLLVYPIEKVRKVVRGEDKGSLQEFLMILAKRVSEKRAGISAPAPAQKPAAKPTPPPPQP
jgi:hypothetical protein